MDSVPFKPDMLGDIQRAMLEFFSVLCTMPHIDADAVRVPPSPQGWSNIGDDELRLRGKTEDALNFVRHLPCLVHNLGRDNPFLTPNIQSLYFFQGEVCLPEEHLLVKTPGHVVWIGDAKNREGSFLLLDTIHGMFIQYLFRSSLMYQAP